MLNIQRSLPDARPIKRIVLLIEEGFIFSRAYLPIILENLSPSLIMVASVKSHKKGQSKYQILRMFAVIGIIPIVILALRYIKNKLISIMPENFVPSTYKSLKSLARDHQIPYKKLGRLNTKKVRTWLEELNPDVVISSVSEILKPDILSIPVMGFINKHAAILPSYRGLMPVVHALSRGEKRIGMTVHRMTENIDDGVILSQRAYPVNENETIFNAYRRVYAKLPDQINEALAVLEGRITPVTVEPQPKKSYYSTPTLSDWIALKQKGHHLL